MRSKDGQRVWLVERKSAGLGVPELLRELEFGKNVKARTFKLPPLVADWVTPVIVRSALKEYLLKQKGGR